MFLAFSVKMDKEQLASYKNEKRRENRSKVRQALLINDYVFYKYSAIYQEAAELYNKINKIYPQKPDLRRTDEFRVWKNNVVGRPNIKRRKPPVERQQYVFSRHPDIPIAQHTDPDASLVIMDTETPQPTSPGHTHPEANLVTMDTETPQPKSSNKKVMELKIPLINPSAKTRPLATQEVPSVTVTEQVTLETVTEQVLNECAPVTLETGTEQVLNEYDADALQPSIYDELSPEIVDKIIQELREDPGLEDIITSVEEQIEIEQVGLEVDVEIQDRLEDELENILFW